MKFRSVYLFALIMLVFTGLFATTGCARGSGCPTGLPTVSDKVKKKGYQKKRGKNADQLFSKKMRKKM